MYLITKIFLRPAGENFHEMPIFSCLGSTLRDVSQIYWPQVFTFSLVMRNAPGFRCVGGNGWWVEIHTHCW